MSAKKAGKGRTMAVRRRSSVAGRAEIQRARAKRAAIGRRARGEAWWRRR
jgi:hypothetical protein